jgi:polyhydroxyalkanoate synthesis regulator protein
MLLKDRLRQLFAKYDQDVQRVIGEVIDLEQQHISNDRPKLKDQIDDIISNVAQKKGVKSGKVNRLERNDVA